jgi:hypothetical protein
MPDVITILENNVVTTQVAGADVLLPMAIAATTALAERAESALAEIQDIAENAEEAPSIANKLNVNGDNIGSNAEALRTAIGVPSLGDAVRPLSSFGALTAGATAMATVEAALADAGRGVVAVIDAPADIGTAPADNPGAVLLGEQPIWYTDPVLTGRRVINHAGRDASLLAWGQECLIRWLSGLKNGDTLSVGIVGNSQMTDGSTYLGYILGFLLDCHPGVSVTNYAISGTSMEEWRTGANGYSAANKALANVVAGTHDLIIIGFGENEPAAAQDADEFDTTYRLCLDDLRAQDVQACSILLLTPNAMNGAGDRDEYHNAIYRPVIRQCALDYQCAFFDRNGLFPDAYVDRGTGDSQDEWLDNIGVHPSELQRDTLAFKIYDFLIPEGLRPNFLSLNARNATDLPETWLQGLGVDRATTGFPGDGFVATIGPQTTATPTKLQINWGADTLGIFARTGIPGFWGPFRTMGLTAIGTNSLIATDVLTAFPMGDTVMRITDASWPVNGYVFTTREMANPAGANGFQRAMSIGADGPMYQRMWVGSWGTWRRVGLVAADLVNAVDDAAAATASVPVGDFYRNGSVVMVRVA